LTNEKITDDFLVFAAGMRIKYGIEQTIYHLRSAVNNRGAFLLDTFSLATQRKVSGVRALSSIKTEKLDKHIKNTQKFKFLS